LEARRREREAGHAPPSRAVKNEWSHTPTPPLPQEGRHSLLPFETVQSAHNIERVLSYDIAVKLGKGKVHPRTGHEGPEGE